jgi:TolA-binding protein
MIRSLTYTTTTIALLIVPLIFTLTSCGPSADVTQMQANQSSLRELVASDRQQIEQLQEKIKQQNDRLAELEHGDQDQDQGPTAAAAESSPAAVPSPGDVATSAAGETAPGSPDNGMEAAAGNPPEGSEDTGLNAPGATPTPGNDVAALPPPPPPEPAATPPAWPSEVNRELASSQRDPASKLYRSGLVDMKADQFKSALVKFQDLQRRYPKSSLSEPAEYFSANALYEMGQDEKSILQFNDLTMRYPDGRFASAALLREAQAFMKINDPIDARLTLQKLLNDHPSAPEAPTAKSMMASLAS